MNKEIKDFLDRNLFTVVIVIIFLIWFVFIKNNQSRESINEDITVQGIQQKMDSDELFEKNLVCSGYKDKIKNDYKLKGFPSDLWKPILQEVFYSQEFNSCLYVEHVESPYQGPLIMKRLMDIKMEVGTEPLESCEKFNQVVWSTLEKDYVRKLGQQETDAFRASIENRNCNQFDAYVDSIRD